MIIDDYNIIKQIIPTASAVELNPADFEPFITDAETWLRKNILGDDLADAIAALDADNRTLQFARRAICHRAYYSGIPFLDLIQTPNGFAVVSNSNQAPASKERVERMILRARHTFASAMDVLLYDCLTVPALNAEWGKFDRFFQLTESVYITSTLFSAHCGLTGNESVLWEEFEAARPEILSIQNRLAKYFSEEYIEELLTGRRNNSLSANDLSIFGYLKIIIGLIYRKKEKDAYAYIEKAINRMVANSDDYPTYISSKAYELKIAEKYANKKPDRTYFFG
jgi:hypothetical protein